MGEKMDETMFCIATELGELIELSEIPELTLDTKDTGCINEDNTNISPDNFSFSLNFKIKGKTKAQLAIMGFPTTNNFRKMHGGVMDRKGQIR